MGNRVEKSILTDLIHFPLKVLGPGVRSGIWVQGCRARCRGCMASHTWKFDQNKRTSLRKITEILKFHLSIGASGLTVSGGEPFDQPKALKDLLISARDCGYQDILIYSRFDAGYLESKFPWIRFLADALIDGSFQRENPTECHWKGSENQKLHIFSGHISLREKYQEYIINSSERKIQIVEKNQICYILGIPRPQDTEKLKNGILQSLSLLQ